MDDELLATILLQRPKKQILGSIILYLVIRLDGFLNRSVGCLPAQALVAIKQYDRFPVML